MTNSDPLIPEPQRRAVPIKAIVIACLMVLALAIGAVAGLPYLVDKSSLKNTLISELSSFGHTKLVANGPLSISAIPNLELSLRDVHSQGIDGPLSLSARTVTTDYAAMSLLSGKLKIGTVTLTDAEIRWDMRLAPGGGAANAKRAFIPSIAALVTNDADARIKLLICARCKLIVIRHDGTELAFEGFSGRIDWPSISGNASVDANFHWNDEAVRVSSQIAKPLALSEGGASLIHIAADSTTASLTFDGETSFADDMFAEGLLTFKAQSLKRFLEWSKPGETAGDNIGNLDLEAKLTTKDGKLLFQDMALGMSGAPASGTFEVDLTTKPIKTSGTLAFGTVDLAALAGALPLGAGGEDDLSLLDAINLDLRLSAKSAAVGAFSIDNAAGAIRINEGMADIDLGTGDFGGGTVMGKLSVSGAPGHRRGKLTASLQNVQGEQFSTAEGGMPVVSAPLSAKAEIEGVYSGLTYLIMNGSGSVFLETGNGVMRNFNMDSFAGLLNTGGSFELTETYAGLSDLDGGTLEGRFRDGMVLVDKGNFKIGGYGLSIIGALPVHSRGIAINGTVSSTNADSNPSGFFIGGTWDRPVVTTGPVKAQ